MPPTVGVIACFEKQIVKIRVAIFEPLCFGSFVDEEKQNQDKATDRAALKIAAGWIVLRHRPYRRNLLFVATLVALVLVFAGAVPLSDFLMKGPVLFTCFWAACFLLVGFVLLLALYDLLQIRKEHNQRMRSLEKELAEAAEEARKTAREQLAADGDDK